MLKIKWGLGLYKYGLGALWICCFTANVLAESKSTILECHVKGESYIHEEIELFFIGEQVLELQITPVHNGVRQEKLLRVDVSNVIDTLPLEVIMDNPSLKVSLDWIVAIGGIDFMPIVISINRKSGEYLKVGYHVTSTNEDLGKYVSYQKSGRCSVLETLF
jgi:hypothetical protein